MTFREKYRLEYGTEPNIRTMCPHEVSNNCENVKGSCRDCWNKEILVDKLVDNSDDNIYMIITLENGAIYKHRLQKSEEKMFFDNLNRRGWLNIDGDIAVNINKITQVRKVNQIKMEV